MESCVNQCPFKNDDNHFLRSSAASKLLKTPGTIAAILEQRGGTLKQSVKEKKTMPQSWNNKDARQFEHIRKSSRKRGKSKKRADEIAARTVNKTRRREGRTPNKTSQGTGNPNVPLQKRTRGELYNKAKAMNIDGRSKMNKGELVSAIRSRQ